jgi:hypothetical protein
VKRHPPTAKIDHFGSRCMMNVTEYGLPTRLIHNPIAFKKERKTKIPWPDHAVSSIPVFRYS